MSKPLGPYSPVVRAGDFVIVSGQGGMRDGKSSRAASPPRRRRRWRTSPPSSPSRRRADRRREDAVLPHRHGHFAEFNEAYAAAFGDHRPARSTVEVSALPGGMAVEVEAWAYKPAMTRTATEPTGAACGAVLGGGPTIGRRTSPTTTPSGACPQRDPRRLFEFLHPRGRPGRAVVVDDPAQARGLPRCFAGFDPARSPRSTTPTSSAASPTRASCATGPRSTAAIGNARAWLELDDPVAFLWSFVDGVPVQNHWTGDGRAAGRDRRRRDAMSKELKRRGFRFVGPTICYALMQACGLVNDHVVDVLPPRRVPPQLA